MPCLGSVRCRPGQAPGLAALREVPVLAVLPVPRTEYFAVVPRSSSVYLITSAGQLVASMGTGGSCDTVAACLSPSGRYLYCAGEDQALYVFDVKLAQLEKLIGAPDAATGAKGSKGGEALQLVHHPTRNVVSAVLRDGSVRIYEY